MKISHYTSNLVFYGCEADAENLASMYSRCVSWMNEQGRPPTHMSMNADGHSGKVGTFKRIAARVKDSTFSTCWGFSFHSMAEGGVSPVWQATCTIELSMRPPMRPPIGTNLFMISTQTVESGFDGRSLQDILPTTINRLAPKYGFGFSMHRRYGPGLYAYGMGVSRADFTREEIIEQHKESERRTKWLYEGDAKKVYLQGLLRDIYPWSFLNESHLLRRIDGKSLREWIESNPRRGRLKAVEGGLTWWEIQEIDVPEVRKVLDVEQIIFK